MALKFPCKTAPHSELDVYHALNYNENISDTQNDSKLRSFPIRELHEVSG